MQNEQTVASIIMTSGGSTFGILGTLLSSLASMYIIKNISTTGCNVVERLPRLLDSTNNTEKEKEQEQAQAQSTNELSTLEKLNITFKSVGINLRSYMWLCVFLGAGILSKKLGTYLSSPESIKYIEKLLYHKQ